MTFRQSDLIYIALDPVFKLSMQCRIALASVWTGEVAKTFVDSQLFVLFSFTHAMAAVHEFEAFLSFFPRAIYLETF